MKVERKENLESGILKQGILRKVFKRKAASPGLMCDRTKIQVSVFLARPL